MNTVYTKAVLVFFAIFSFTFVSGTQASTSEDLAKEISGAVDRSLDSSFGADINTKISGKGQADGINFDISYDSGIMKAVKAKNAFSILSSNAVFSVQLDVIEGKNNPNELLFPMNISGKYAGGFLADIDAMKFAGKFYYSHLTVQGNTRLNNVIIGAKEMFEPFENKWIELDMGALEKEFPDILDDMDKIREEILEDFKREFSGEDLESILQEGIESGIINVTKTSVSQGSLYTIVSGEALVGAMTGLESPVLELTIYRGVITKFSISGQMNNFWTPAGNFSGKMNISADMKYGNQVLQWPTFQTKDWELTKIVRMFMEFKQEENNQEKLRNAVWYNLEKDLVASPQMDAQKKFIESKTSEKNVQTALSILLASDQEKTVKAYLTRFSDLDKKVNASDIFFLSRYNNVYWSTWQKDYIRSEFSHKKNNFIDNQENAFFQQKEMRSKYEMEERAFRVLQIVDKEIFSYQPYSVKIDTPKVYYMETKADLLVLMARGVQAKSLR